MIPSLSGVITNVDVSGVNWVLTTFDVSNIPEVITTFDTSNVPGIITTFNAVQFGGGEAVYGVTISISGITVL